MRVCVVSIKECWRDAGGAWYADGGFPRQMDALASIFDAMELLVTEVAPREGGLPLPAAARVVPLRKPGGTDLRRKLAFAARLPEYVGAIVRHAWRADVIHTPLPGDLALLGLWVGLALRKRVLARYGGSWHPTAVTTLFNRITRASMRAFAGGRNVMLAAGAGVRPPARNVNWLFSSAISEQELRVIQPRFDRGIGSPPRIVYLGRLSPEKGVTVLIRAVAILARSGFAPMPQVLLIGGGPQRAELEALLERLECRPWVRMTGQLRREQLRPLVDAADFCVQPSFTESLSKAWIDAMAHGLPVLTSPVGAAAEAIGGEGGRGWLVPPGDPEALAARIRGVIEGPVDWPALRRRCREYAESHTLEGWRDRIAMLCAAQWNCRLSNGRLVAG
jgi:glycosyltransferase involved in cell wall biosynthesis